MSERHYFKRPCIRCKNLFTPTGKFQKICDKCNKGKGSRENLKKKYFKTKEQLDIIRSNETLAKWKALSHAYKLGKRIWGSHFTKQRLAYDMELPLTTTLRCLALDKANKRSWKLVEQGEISAFKLAMICQTKSITYQDEIVDLVIKNNYSTYQIKSLKINKLSDINKERHRLAIEKGYSRKDSAARNFKMWIDRGKLFLLLKKTALSEEKYNEIRKELKELNKKIERYLSSN